MNGDSKRNKLGKNKTNLQRRPESVEIKEQWIISSRCTFIIIIYSYTHYIRVMIVRFLIKRKEDFGVGGDS